MFKILKQELLFIPLMLIILELFRNVIHYVYPETALFDKGSELETFLFRVWQLTWITSSVWLIMRVVFPPAFHALGDFYKKFDQFSADYKETMSVKIFLVFFLSLVYLCGKGQSRETFIRAKLCDTLHSQLYVREATGNNDGIEVERYLSFVNRYKGDSWCAAYVSSNLNYVGVTKPINPISAWAPSFANPKYIVWQPKSKTLYQVIPGDIFTLFYPAHNRVGHVGFITADNGNYLITNEGNTGLSGSREGSGVHALKRSKIKVFAISNYITPYLKLNEKTCNKIILNRIAVDNYTEFLSQKINGIIDTNQYRKERQFICEKGFDLVPGLYFENKRIYNHNQYRCESRFKWENKPCPDSNRHAAIASRGINYRWETINKMYLQRLGTKGSASATAFNRIRFKEQTKAKGRDCFKNSGSAVYTQMG